MNKKRKVGENWFLLDFDARSQLMAEHGRTGMTFGGKVTQLITVGLGFDDWEWGVTLWARNPEFLKEIVYRMRFDEASARYAEFGPFYVSYVMTPPKCSSTAASDRRAANKPPSGAISSASASAPSARGCPAGECARCRPRNSSSSLAWLLSTGKSSMALGKFETQMKSPDSAR